MAKLTMKSSSENNSAHKGGRDDRGRKKASPEAAVPGQREAQRSNSDKGPALFKEEKVDMGPEYGYRKIRLHKKDEVNPYGEMQDARHAMDSRARTIWILAGIAFLVFILVAIMPTNLFMPGQESRSPAQILASIQSSATGLLAMFTGQETMYSTYALTVLVTALAGAALALSGGVYQGALGNALASPSTLGVTQGGTFGLIIYVAFMYNWEIYSGDISDYNDYLASMGPLEYVFETYGTYLASIIGCFAVVGLVMFLATVAGRGKVGNVSLIIAGQVFAAAATIGMTWIKYYVQMTETDPRVLELIVNTQSSTFTGAYTFASVATFAIPLIICMAVVFLMSSRLGILSFNDDEARSMGISTRRTRNIMVFVCTAMSALVISFCGSVGFVGFLVPHIARRLVGADFRYLLPACTLVGCILVTGVYYFTQLGIPGVPSNATGFFTSIIGCVAFIVIALRQRRNSSGDWI